MAPLVDRTSRRVSRNKLYNTKFSPNIPFCGAIYTTYLSLINRAPFQFRKNSRRAFVFSPVDFLASTAMAYLALSSFEITSKPWIGMVVSSAAIGMLFQGRIREDVVFMRRCLATLAVELRKNYLISFVWSEEEGDLVDAKALLS